MSSSSLPLDPFFNALTAKPYRSSRAHGKGESLGISVKPNFRMAEHLRRPFNVEEFIRSHPAAIRPQTANPEGLIIRAPGLRARRLPYPKTMTVMKTAKKNGRITPSRTTMVGENLIKEMETNDGGNYFRPSFERERAFGTNFGWQLEDFLMADRLALGVSA